MVDINEFAGKSIEKFRLLMLNENYLEYKENKTFIIDGGFEFLIENKPYCISFLDEETQEFNVYQKSGDQLLEGYDFFEVDLTSELRHELSSKKIQHVDLKNLSVIVEEFDGSLLEESQTLVQINFLFDDDTVLQIAIVNYSIHPESLQFTDIWYDLEGLIIVNFDEEISIR